MFYKISFLSNKDNSWLSLQEAVENNNLIVSTDYNKKLYSAYITHCSKINFTKSFISHPRIEFWLEFKSLISLRIEDYKLIPVHFLGKRDFINSIYCYQFIDMVKQHKTNSELKEIIIKSVDCYTEKEWRMIFKYVKFNTVELLKLEDYALKHLYTVCENQNITNILKERWKDQKGFFDNKVPKEEAKQCNSNELHATPLDASLVNPYKLIYEQFFKIYGEEEMDNRTMLTPTQVKNNLKGCHSCCKKEKKKSIKRKKKRRNQ